LSALPLLTSGRADLLDHERLQTQLVNLKDDGEVAEGMSSTMQAEGTTTSRIQRAARSCWPT